MSRQQIIDEIIAFIQHKGGDYRDWYVGIAMNPKNRLFNEHKVNEWSDPWIIRNAGSEEEARAIEKIFNDNYKTQGGLGGGDAASEFVYAYLINGHTKE